jgi:ribosomal subunit interface protein
MRLELTGRHIDINPTLRKLVDRKLVKLDRLLNGRAISAQVVLTFEKRRRRAEFTVHARGERFLHGAADTSTWNASVNGAVDKIKSQVEKLKVKRRKR